jgi:hypothetical protein
MVTITLNHSTEERVKLRNDYKEKYSKDLLELFEKQFGSEFRTCLIGLFQTHAEYDAYLLYTAMKGLGSDKELITEVLCFRSPDRINEIKTEFKKKYGKELLDEVKDETSGDYRKIALALLEANRDTNTSPDVEKCAKIAKELYDAGENKLGTNEEVFIKYFTTLSPDDLLIVCKEYHKAYKKNMMDILHNEFNGDTRDLLQRILYGLYSPCEFYATQIRKAVEGLGTNDAKLIRSVIANYDGDMKRIKKYYKKINNKELLDDIKDKVKGSYEKILEILINKLG